MHLLIVCFHSTEHKYFETCLFCILTDTSSICSILALSISWKTEYKPDNIYIYIYYIEFLEVIFKVGISMHS